MGTSYGLCFRKPGWLRPHCAACASFACHLAVRRKYRFFLGDKRWPRAPAMQTTTEPKRSLRQKARGNKECGRFALLNGLGALHALPSRGAGAWETSMEAAILASQPSSNSSRRILPPCPTLYLSSHVHMVKSLVAVAGLTVRALPALRRRLRRLGASRNGEIQLAKVG